MRYHIRPLGTWTGPVTTDRQSSAVFRASWDDTLDLLCREVDALDGSLVVLQVEADPDDIRRDGMLRSRAQVGFPGVRVSFDSRHGPLTYATDAYEQRYHNAMPGWQANIRATALGLGALRAVDRYGISGRGEQYVGWTAIGSAPAKVPFDGAAAQALLDRYGGLRPALMATHPDRGGNADDFACVQEARRVLGL